MSYSTAVTWNCGTIVSGCSVSGDDLNIGDLVIRYAPNSASPDAPLSPGFTGAGFGDLIALCTAGGDCTSLTDISGAQLMVTINQTVPFVQSVSFNGVLGGQISNTQSLNPAFTLFDPLTASTDNGAGLIINYFLQQPTTPVNGYILNLINDNSSTSLQGAINIQDTETPEPSTVALIGLGLAAIGFRRRNS